MSEDSIQKGRQAEIELEATNEAFETIRNGLIQRLLKTGVKESALRDNLVLTVQALDMVKDILLTAVQSGKDSLTIEAHVQEAFSNHHKGDQ